jgi:hypothetical protein
MMCRKRFIAVLIVLGISVCGTASSTVIKYNFSQSGYDEGAIVTGMFEGEDLNGDGFLVGNEGPDAFNEITSFNMKFSGNSIVPAFTIDFAEFSDSATPGVVAYDLNEGPFLGDGGGSSQEIFFVTSLDDLAVGEVGIFLFGKCNPNSACGDVVSGGSVTHSSELMKVSAIPLPAAVSVFFKIVVA